MPAPSSAAMRRMETASKPSASAIRSAACAICSRVWPARRMPGSGRVQIGPARPSASPSPGRAALPPRGRPGSLLTFVQRTAKVVVRCTNRTYEVRRCRRDRRRRARAGQALRRPVGAPRPRPGRPRRLRPRPAGPQRRGQDDRHPHSHHARAADHRPRRASPGSTSSPRRRRSARRIGVAGQYATVDGLLTARANLEMVGRLHHLPRREARRACRRAAGALRARRRRRAAGQDLLGRDAPPARPRREPRRRPAGPLPRRADHRAGPAEPRRALGRCCASSSATAPRSSSPRSTSRRPTAWPTRSSCSTAAGSPRRARPPSSSAGSAASGSRSRCAAADRLGAAVARARAVRRRRAAAADAERRR